MIRKGIKFTHNTLEYYELNVSNNVSLEQISLKLSAFKELSNNINAPYIVLSFDDSCTDLLQINNLVNMVIESARLNNLTISLIKANPNLLGDTILGIRVVELPHLKKVKSQEHKTLYINTPIRSGASIYNDGDVIIDNFISNGAEIVATGNIHIYGEVRGRLIAGSDGDKKAKIFVTKFNPELIAIGGVYRVIDTKLPEHLLNKFVSVSLDEKDKFNIVLIA